VVWLERFFVPFFSFLLLNGCVSVADLNYSSSKIENAWLLEYQKIEDSFRTRVVEASASETFVQVKKTLVDLGLPVVGSDTADGEIYAQGIAPAPLTQDEWELVAKIENPRVKELSDGWMYLNDDPSDYMLTVKVTVLGGENKSLVILDYELSAPKYEAMGFQMPRVAPPHAVALGSTRFWSVLDKNLNKNAVAPARKKLKNESFNQA
jgi:hypothetical protein|tara:strand:+ start:333 stop:956 length:624 start_codon:yes stop_codon:yes gene_type:complete